MHAIRLSGFLLVMTAFCSFLPADAPNVRTPDGLKSTQFSGPELTPCVACLSVAPSGEVFVGIDRKGSLGKGGGGGSILRLIDTDGDGKADKHTVYAKLDNPRGLMAVGRKLYVLHTRWKDDKNFEGMYLSVLEDNDWDGVADGGPKILISQVSTVKFNQARGVDHTTNGIRMGIDGWIYIAIGDFGYVDAKGTDGRTLTMYGGGVLRVRPDGTEMEEYVHGLRNIYDIAIDPKMNMFTRGNTNDGGGWNIRFIHEIQTGQYGYPKLFKRYTHEIIPALVDVGGGSGTGSMFFSEPGWPAKYSNVPMMCDWGKGQLFIHRVTPDGPSFTQKQEEFIRCSRITDVDVDGSGRLYLGSWHGSGFKGGNGGFVAQVTPEGHQAKPFPDLIKANDRTLAGYLKSDSATMRLAAQQELLIRDVGAASAIQAVAEDKRASVDSRIAAIFTLKQLIGEKSHPALLMLTKDAAVQEHALRALADLKSQVKGVPLEPFYAGLKSDNPRVQVAAAVGLGRLGRKEAASALLAVSNPPKLQDLPQPKKAEPVAPKQAEAPKTSGKKPKYASKVIKHRATVNIDVDITGFKQLALMVDDAGDGNGEDHGSWFEPTLITKSGKKIKLTDLKWKKASQGWGKTLVNKNCTGKKLARHDNKPVAFGIGSHSPSVITYHKLPKDVVRFQAVGGISNSGKGSVRFMVNDVPTLKASSKKKKKKAGPKIPEGPHATPNPGIIVPHVAVKALIDLEAAEACLKSIGTPNQAGGLWALRYIHNETAVSGLIEALESTSGETRYRVAESLVRLVNKEKVYKGDTWWGTRPDTRGPYYYPTAWEQTERAKAALLKAAKSDAATGQVIALLAEKDRVAIEGLPKTGSQSALQAVEQPTQDLEKIKNKKGQIAKMSLEDVLIALGKVKGDVKRGKMLFTQQGCAVCHTIEKGQPLKGPHMGQIGSIMNKEQIATSILRPNAEISQGFKTVMITMKDGKTYTGFVSKRLSDLLEIRDITGRVTRLDPMKVKSENLMPTSMMPPGLANGLSISDFVSLVTFLSQQKK